MPAGVTVGIRPEHVLLNTGAGPAVTGTVEGIENLGHEKLWFFTAEIGRIVARTPDTGSYRLGETVSLRFPPERLHLFDAATGKRREPDL